jgi:hypothetical protein
MFMKQSNGKCRTNQELADFIGEIDYAVCGERSKLAAK